MTFQNAPKPRHTLISVAVKNHRIITQLVYLLEKWLIYRVHGSAVFQFLFPQPDTLLKCRAVEPLAADADLINLCPVSQGIFERSRNLEHIAPHALGFGGGKKSINHTFFLVR